MSCVMAVFQAPTRLQRRLPRCYQNTGQLSIPVDPKDLPQDHLFTSCSRVSRTGRLETLGSGKQCVFTNTRSRSWPPI